MTIDPVALLSRLIQFDTTTPPGGEAEAIRLVRSLLAEAGIESHVLESAPGRPNLLARVAGSGNLPPLLMQAHIDVVPADRHGWTHPPFAGEVADGFVWGRGALDMKGGLVMMLDALSRILERGATLPGDVILAVVSDEEGGGAHGARFLVNQHPELFAGVRYAIGEFGGFTLRMAGRTYTAVQVAEKQLCHVRATIRGTGGHGSLALQDGVSARLAELLRRLSSPRLPVHVVPVVENMLRTAAAGLPRPARAAVLQLLRPAVANRVLRLGGGQGRVLTPLMRNTATPNLVSAGEKINVQPTQAQVHLDGRLLPGFTPEQFLAELSILLGSDVELEVLHHDPTPATADLGLFPTLATVLREFQPGAEPLPILLPASTDGRFFSLLGIQSYGFTPMILPPEMAFMTLVHGVDERIPVDAVRNGSRCIERLLSTRPL